MSVTNGALVASPGGSMSWEYCYPLNLAVANFSGDQDRLMATVQLWLNANQPDAINHPQRRETLFTFAIDTLGSISLTLQLTEPVGVNSDINPPDVAAQPEPQPAEEMWAIKPQPTVATVSPSDKVSL